jgi:lipopolysaccharide export system protein LptA
MALVWPTVGRSEVETGDRDEVEVEARNVELDSAGGIALFEGDVLLRHGSIELRCQRLTAEVDQGGRLVRLEASGQVRLSAEGILASAGAATYQPSTGVVTLRGQPQVRHAAGTLRGRVITYHSREGRLSVEDAHGVFRLK